MSTVPKPEVVPTLKPVLFFDFKIKDIPKQLLHDKSRTLGYAIVNGGSIKSCDPEYPFDATLEFCLDEMTTLNTGNSSALDCKVYLTSNKTGKGIHCHYSGVLNLNEKTQELMDSSAEKYLTYDDCYCTCHPVFKVDEEAEDEIKWILKHNFIGKGRFIRDSEGILRVQYYVYILA